MMKLERSQEFIDYLNNIILYLETTESDSWCTDVVRNKDGKNCFFGHLLNMGKIQEQSCNLWDEFENCVATTYMIYPVNDGKNSKYQQPTSKERCIAYLEDVRDGKVMTTYESMDEEMELFKSQQL